MFNLTNSEIFGSPLPSGDNPDLWGLEIEFEGARQPEQPLPDDFDDLDPDTQEDILSDRARNRRRYINIPQTKGWNIVEDGSLRDGLEAVTAGPQRYEDLPQLLDNLNAAFAKINFTPVFGYRTSLHVHMNVHDMTLRELINLFILYSLFERALVDFGGEERRGNMHCLLVTEATRPFDLLREMCTAKTQAEAMRLLRQLCHNNFRYSAFNWASYSRYGTIEFRSHRGTSDTRAVMLWVSLLRRLKEKAKEFDDPRAIMVEFSRRGPDGFAEFIFGKHSFAYFTPTLYRYHSDMWEAARLCQDVAFCRKDWVGEKEEVKSKVRPWDGVSPIEEGEAVETIGGVVMVGPRPDLRNFRLQVIRNLADQDAFWADEV